MTVSLVCYDTLDIECFDSLSSGLSPIFLCNEIHSFMVFESDQILLTSQCSGLYYHSNLNLMALSVARFRIISDRTSKYVVITWDTLGTVFDPCGPQQSTRSPFCTAFPSASQLSSSFPNVVYYISRSPNCDSLDWGPEHGNFSSPSTWHISPKCHTGQPFCFLPK